MSRSAVSSMVCGLLLLAALPADSRGEDRDVFKEQVRPLLQRYCIDCHNADDASGDISFEGFDDRAKAIADGEVWFKALEALESRIMPPEDARQPTEEEIAKIVKWIEGDYFDSQCGKVAPAKVILRRLNRHEYNNTIRDLVGIDLRPGDDFPQDEIGFGYDNIGSALSTSPSHVEKHLDAAERVVEAAITLPDASSFPPAELVGLQTLPLSPTNPVGFDREFGEGRYLVDVVLNRRPTPDVPPPKLTIGIGEDRRTVEAAVERDDGTIYRVWLQALAGKNRVSIALSGVPATPAPEEPMPEGRGRGRPGLSVESIVVRGPHVLDFAQLPEAHRRIVFVMPELGDESRFETAERIVTRFAERAFRRPVREEEVARLMKVFRLADSRGESFERSLQVAVATVLVSPQFLFLVEPDAATEDRPLTEFELASRLSYFLWSSLPDDSLLDAARRGTLRQNLREHVGRMLDDRRSDAFIRNFAGQWLQLRKLPGLTPDRDLYPEFDEPLREAMREETERFFADVVRNNRSILDLLDCDYTYLNNRLARHYGIEGVEGPEFRRVSLADRVRGGLLTQASVLSITSNPNRTSPVKRGQWILEQLLATPPPPPPPEVEKLDESKEVAATATLRERLETHRSKAECAACHKRMDPLGFALENFDAVGKWRASDGEFAVDPSGKLTDGRSFADIRELKVLLKAEPKKFSRALIKGLLTYALGRGLESRDRCTIETMRQQLVGADYRFRSIIVSIVESSEFQHRGVSR